MKIEVTCKTKFPRERKSVPNSEIMAISTVNESKESLNGTAEELDQVPTLLYTTPTPDCERRSTYFSSLYSANANYNPDSCKHVEEDSTLDTTQHFIPVATFKLESDV